MIIANISPGVEFPVQMRNFTKLRTTRLEFTIPFKLGLDLGVFRYENRVEAGFLNFFMQFLITVIIVQQSNLISTFSESYQCKRESF